MHPIINSLADTDLYKITMGSAYFSGFANVTGRFVFKDRHNQIECTAQFLADLNKQLDHLCTLKFTKEELDYIFGLRFMRDKVGYREFLRNFQLNRDWIIARIVDGKLSIETKEAPILATSMFEIYVLAIVNCLYTWSLPLPRGDKLSEVLEKFEDIRCPFIEMGTRRRYDYLFQEKLLYSLKSNPKFIGTSNIHFAMKLGYTPMGTMAHEFLQVGQGLSHVPVADSQRYMFDFWAKHYNGDLGIALSDNLGTNKFLEDFSPYYAKLFDGVRHDSGDPIQWTKQMLAMYQRYGIHTKTKKLIFSDSLDVEKANKIADACGEVVQMSAGIGTALTNPICPTNIVMKLVSVNGKPVAKLSNDPGKGMCEDSEYQKYLEKVCGFNQEAV